jgi:RNA polymerase sigma-70 factor (ECF subfamily)
MPGESSTPFSTCLERLRLGDAAAREELVARAQEQLRKLTHQRLNRWPSLQRWVETDDVLQGALIRLHRALEAVKPESSQHFVRLAACQIRRELVDLGRKFFGPEGLAARHATPPLHSPGENTPVSPLDVPQNTNDPFSLSAWTELHNQVEQLPDDERETFEQLWYLGLSQTEAAEALGVDRTTVIRRWHRARRRLLHSLQGNLPGAS